MTEIEKIEYAKMFIDKLANGIDPLNDTPIKEDDIVNNVRLSRCFFFVSDVLRQVIENGGVTRKKISAKPFSLTVEQLANFNFSDTAIAISEIAKRLNALTEDEHMQKISHRDLSNWLLSIGMLKEEPTVEGKTAKCPTAQGEAIGIFTEPRIGQRGAYTAVLYRREAQNFIVDNLNAVLVLKYNK